MKKYILIAGVNGAGKSTLYQISESLKNMERVNSDEIVRSFGDWKNPVDVINAGKIAVSKIDEYLRNGTSFNQETTLCGKAIINNIERAKSLGYWIEVHYIGVASIDIAKKRIAYRVAHGGHDIAEVDVERRYIESFKQLNKIKGKCNLVVLYDNTEVFNRFAVYQDGILTREADEVPEWFEKYVY